MKYNFGILFFILLHLTLVSCKEEPRDDRAFENFKNFVCERQLLNYRFNDVEWAELETTYHELRINAEVLTEHNVYEKGSEYASLLNDWNDFKIYYAAENDRLRKELEVTALENELFPPGVTKDLRNVEAHNLKDVELHFANVVEAHKGELTSAQWHLVNSLRDVLSEKKKEFSKKVKVSDKPVIKHRQIEFITVKEPGNFAIADSTNQLSRLY